MPTVFHRLEESPEDYNILHSTALGVFLEGECYAFALALHQGLGWPLVGLIKPKDEVDGREDVIWHAGVRSPDGRIHDVRGFLDEAEFGNYFLSSPFTIREVTAAELYETRGTIDERAIASARRAAETLWPDLPWINSARMRIQAFADALEALSREHKIWIRAPYPTTQPMLAMGDDDEYGYEIRPIGDGQAHSIARVFPFELKS